MQAHVPAWVSRLPAAGLLVWLAVAGVRAPAGLDEATLAELIVLFMPLCAVPLALPRTVRADRSERTGANGPVKWAAIAWAFAAGLMALGVAFVETGGPLATALAIPWLVFAAVIGVHGVVRLVTRSRLVAAELAIDVGLLCLPGAALWLLVYRAEWVFAGFRGLSAVLTAAHFHTAGFGALVMAGLVGRGLAQAGRSAARRVHAVVVVAMVIAFVSLAAGIATGWRPIEAFGACLYAVALPAIAGMQMFAGRGAVALRVVSSLCLLVATVYAMIFAMQGFYGTAVPIATMLRLHGVVNAIGFVGLGLWAWSRVRPAELAGSAGIPWSRLRSRGAVGAEFFINYAPSSAAAPAGLCDDLAVFDRPGFTAANVDAEVRAFYEATSRFTLTVTARWRFPFRFGGRVWHALGRRMGQLMLPVGGSEVMPSRIVAVDAAVDGRPGVRGWIRQLGQGAAPVYVAAYATHTDPGGHTYMNIAFPLPRANLASLLRVDHDPRRAGGLVLTTCSTGQDDFGDQGVYLVTAVGAARLPMNETIWVWSPDPGEGCALRARHVLWLAGIPYLELDYAIARTG